MEDLPICENCGDPVRHAGDADICDEEHDQDRPVVLHADCPCPDHGWDGDRTGYANPDSDPGTMR